MADLAWDITGRKRTEEALKESECHSRALIEAIPDMIFRISREGIYIDYKADNKDLAYQENLIIGKKYQDISCNISDDLSVFADLHMVQTVLRNFVVNAVKFTCKGGKIKVSANKSEQIGQPRLLIRPCYLTIASVFTIFPNASVRYGFIVYNPAGISLSEFNASVFTISSPASIIFLFWFLFI